MNTFFLTQVIFFYIILHTCFPTKLSTAYRISDSREIKVASKINSVSVTWALGSILYEIGMTACKDGREKCIDPKDLPSYVHPGRDALPIVMIVTGSIIGVLIVFLLCAYLFAFITGKLIAKKPEPAAKSSYDDYYSRMNDNNNLVVNNNEHWKHCNQSVHVMNFLKV